MTGRLQNSSGLAAARLEAHPYTHLGLKARSIPFLTTSTTTRDLRHAVQHEYRDGLVVIDPQAMGNESGITARGGQI